MVRPTRHTPSSLCLMVFIVGQAACLAGSNLSEGEAGGTTEEMPALTGGQTAGSGGNTVGGTSNDGAGIGLPDYINNPNELPLSRLIGGAEMDPNAYWPPTGQICTAELQSSGEVPTKAPQALIDSCSACHGLTGEGARKIPGIKKNRSYADFAALIRAGLSGLSGEMPAFPETWLNEPELKRIYAYAMQVPLMETGVCTPKPATVSKDFDAIYAAGLAKWRKQDGHFDPNGVKSNVACVQCHAADPLDIAYYGFADGDILRRGNQHLPVVEVAPIVDMVHALREKYSIGRREPLISRPFQPGGGLLPGDSIAARDAAFGKELQDMNLRIISAPIVSIADADAAYAQLANVDMHMLRIPIPFNHYSEDMFHNVDGKAVDCNSDVDNCKDHGSIGDWIPSSPHIVSNTQSWVAKMDAYLANPNMSTYDGYRGAIPSQDTMPGNYGYGTRGVEGAKYKAQTLANFCLQLEVRGQKGCYDMGVAPFPNRADIWDVGATANLFGTGYAAYPDCDVGKVKCSDPPAKLPQWPDHLRDDLSPGATWSSNFSKLRHPWMTAWWVHFDPTLLVTGDPTAQKDEYFTRSLFWANLNDWQFSGTPQSQARPAYAIFAAWEVMMHNVAVLQNPKMSTCKLYPANDFACTAVDLRSGFFPNVINFAEQNQADKPESQNNINYQIRFMPTDPEPRAAFQMLTANMYRMFLYRTIAQLQKDNWMCRPDIQRLRMARAKKFFDAAETQKAVASADTSLLAQLEGLIAKSRTECPPQ